MPTFAPEREWLQREPLQQIPSERVSAWALFVQCTCSLMEAGVGHIQPRRCCHGLALTGSLKGRSIMEAVDPARLPTLRLV